MNLAIPHKSLRSETGSRRISVVHLVLSLNIGGLEKVVYDLVRFVARHEFATRVVCLGEIGALGPAFQEVGIPVESQGLHGKGILRGIVAVAKRLRELQPDILHTHNAAAHIIGAFAARWAGIPVVVQTRHGMHQIQGLSTTLANRIATRLTHRLVAVSAAAAATSRVNDRVRKARLTIIRNGVDLDLYRQREWGVPGRPLNEKAGNEVEDEGSRTEDGETPDPVCRLTVRAYFQAIHAARLDYSTKDQRTLLRAVRLVVDQEPCFRLDIVGDGPDRSTLEALCDELELRSHVNFRGFRNDVHVLLPQADLFVLSSVTEGLPMTLLEAMAAGLPIVSTDVGGISELVKHNQTGLLVPSQSPEALAGAILELMDDRQRAADMGRAGRRCVEEEFDIRVVTARYEELYRTLLRENR